MGRKLVHVCMNGNQRQLDEVKRIFEGFREQEILKDYVFVFTNKQVKMQVDALPVLEEIRDLMKILVDLKMKQLGISSAKILGKEGVGMLKAPCTGCDRFIDEKCTEITFETGPPWTCFLKFQ